LEVEIRHSVLGTNRFEFRVSLLDEAWEQVSSLEQKLKECSRLNSGIQTDKRWKLFQVSMKRLTFQIQKAEEQQDILHKVLYDEGLGQVDNHGATSTLRSQSPPLAAMTFNEYDTDKDGVIDRQEFRRGKSSGNLSFNPPAVDINAHDIVSIQRPWQAQASRTPGNGRVSHRLRRKRPVRAAR